MNEHDPERRGTNQNKLGGLQMSYWTIGHETVTT